MYAIGFIPRNYLRFDLERSAFRIAAAARQAVGETKALDLIGNPDVLGRRERIRIIETAESDVQGLGELFIAIRFPGQGCPAQLTKSPTCLP